MYGQKRRAVSPGSVTPLSHVVLMTVAPLPVPPQHGLPTHRELRQGFGPHRIAWALGLARSTVYAVLRRFGLNRLDRLHRRQPRDGTLRVPAPGDLLHLDVKKLGRVSLRPTHMSMSAAGAGVMPAVAPRR